MPTAPRPSRSLLALALVVNLLAAIAPTAALGVQRDSDPTSTPIASTAIGPSPDAVDRRTEALTEASLTSRPLVATIPAGWTDRPATTVPAPKPTTVSKQKVSSRGSAKASGFHGRNHVWIPALGINRSVAGYSCSSGYYPGNRVYRWGCAGGNNVYLFGHAFSVFKPLHDAYVRGRLRKGMKVYYAAANGKVSTYAVSWWRLTTPAKGTWAYAGLSRPSLTLQTCVGARSQYRLIVRLAKVG
jgi:sortase (surface protein transpeptidase)